MRDSRFAAFVLLFGVAPALIKKSKPLGRYFGDQFIRIGEYLKSGTDDTSAASKGSVANSTGANAKQVHTDEKVESAGPLGKDEVAPHLAAEAMGDGAATEPVMPKKKPSTKNKAPKEAGASSAATNPKKPKS